MKSLGSEVGLTSVTVCGVVPVAAIYSAGIVAWRMLYRHYRHYSGTTTVLSRLLEELREVLPSLKAPGHECAHFD